MIPAPQLFKPAISMWLAFAGLVLVVVVVTVIVNRAVQPRSVTIYFDYGATPITTVVVPVRP